MLGEIDNVDIVDQDVSVTFDKLLSPRTLSLTVETPDGGDVSDEVSITWMDEKGNFLCNGNTLERQMEGTTVKYRVTLPQELAMEYFLPVDVEYEVADANSITYTLTAIPQTTISGKVIDVKSGNPLSGATVAVSQMLNGLYSVAYTIKTDANGAWSQTVYQTKTDITASMTDYVSQTQTYEAPVAEVPTFELKDVSGTTILLNLTYTNTEGETQNFYSDYANVVYSVFNQTTGQQITDLNVQYPQIVLMESLPEGTELRVVAESKSQKFMPVATITSVDSRDVASVTLPIVQLGGIKASFSQTDNNSVVGILYDGNGRLVKKYNYDSAALNISELWDGEYTLVTMGNSQLFNNVASIEQFYENGLRVGVDYVKNIVFVKNGEISAVNNSQIPFLDESKLYYTGEMTTFSVNKSHVSVGQYLTISGRLDFKKAYADRVSDVKLIVYLPEGCTFVNNSVISGNSSCGYVYENQRVVVPLNNYNELVRFCVIPTEGAEKNIIGQVQFKLDNNHINQPIGILSYTAKELEINVPSVVSRTIVPISGVCPGQSTIEIYDNNQLIGKTTSISNNTWSTTIDLGDTYSLSEHSIFAKVITKQGGVLSTETKDLIYNRKAIEARNVVMTFYNGWLNKNIDVVFDFEANKVSSTSYDFYTETDFTFVVDFTENDTTKISDVKVKIYTSQNNWKVLDASFNEKIGKWVAVSRFNASELPSGVSVDFSFAENVPYDESITTDYNDSMQAALNENEDVISEIEHLENELYTELDNNIIDEEKIRVLNDSIDSLLNLSPTEKELIDNAFNYYINIWRNNFAEKSDYEGFEETYSNPGPSNPLFPQPYDNIPSGLESFIENFSQGQGLSNQTMSYVSDNGIEVTYTRNGSDTSLNSLLAQEGKWELLSSSGSDSRVVTLQNSSSGDVITLNESNILPEPTIGDNGNITNWGDYLNVAVQTMDWYSNQDALQLWLDVLGSASNSMYNREKLLYGLSYKLSQTLLRENYREIAKNLANKHLIKMNLSGILNGFGKFISGVNTFAGGWSIGSSINKQWNNAEEWGRLIDKALLHCNPQDGLEISEKALNYMNMYQWRNGFNTLGKTGLSGVGIASACASELTLGASLLITGACYLANKGLQYWENNFTNDDSNRKKEIRRLLKSKCNYVDPLDPDSKTPALKSEGKLDPSGYVYEAVSSNRLQGVTASVYYKETVEDMYGDLHENIVLWNAEEYAQQNPLFTDENGMYRWDVPQGLWQVKFEKEGYETTYSEWLPVPPPQLDVNIAMRQFLQPTVKNVKAYADGIEMEFDKYMDPETLTPDNILVTKNGNAVNGTIKLLNEEVAYEGQNQTYASKVRFEVPEEEKLLTTDEVQLTVRRAVKSYAGTPMENDYTQQFDVELQVQSVVVDSLINVAYGGQRTIMVAALPVDAAKGKTIKVKPLSSMIAKADVETLTLDENGQAELTVTGELPGTTAMSFAVDGTDVKGLMTVNVKDAANLVAIAPRASRVSGTEVYRGTQIRLTSETENATIYYTLDGSCPCDLTSESVIKYNPDEPIIIADDQVTIKAMATGHDLGESDVAEFTYSLKKSTLGYQMPTGWSWISHNLEEPVPTTSFQTNVERIVSQTAEQIYDPTLGFVGNLNELQPVETYKVKVSAPTENRLSGYEFNAVANSLNVAAGWNWLGYPLNQTMSLPEAFAFFTPSEGDYIMGQDGFAEFSNSEWHGTLEGMVPGKGYMYKSATETEIRFNTTIVSEAGSKLRKRNLLGNSLWSYDKNAYPNIMPVIAELYDDRVIVDDDEYTVGAFSGSECRGIGQWKDGRLMLSIFGEGNEPIRFIAADQAGENLYDISETLAFEPDNKGTWHAPMKLTIGQLTTNINNLYDGLVVSPVVFSDHISVSVDGHGISRLTLTNMLGVNVIDISNLGTGGTVTTTGLADGVYVLMVQTEGRTYYKKIMKANI